MSYTNGLDKPTDYFNTKLYTGNGSTQSISGIGFQPDWVWTKNRDNGAEWHTLYDSVRGVYKRLYTNVTNGEESTTQSLTSFDSDGFSLGAYSGSNGNGENIVSWNWLASNTTASNTDGSITSTVSANTTAGFSIVSYTGNGTDNATVGHGLGQKPDCLIVKNRSAAHGWGFWSKSLGAETQQLGLNLTNAVFTDDVFKSSNSTTVTLGVDTWSNNNAENYVMYCFAEKKGFSKFGSYTGNGSADGPFVYTGFKPAFLITKMYNTTGGSWGIVDGTRNEFNVVNKWNFADSSGAEFSSVNVCDFLSNGFKFRAVDTSSNSSGNSYIYMAFAESPFVTSTGIPTVAR